MNTNEEIKYYISQKSNTGALLVTGKWGCGKTYLIRKIIKELNAGNECVAVLVSLFGVDSIELLHKEIKNKVFFSRGFEKAQKKSKHIVSRVKKFSVNATDILGETFSIAKSINKALTIRWQDYFNVEKDLYCYSEKSETKNHLVKKKLVLFFDDFERSKLDRIELMGVINEYSENREVKVVLIADEDKITDKEKNKEECLENNIYKYSEFKEKLISRTIKIKTDYKSTIDSIVTSYEETVENYKNFLIKNKDLIYRIFSESETNNFRSVKAFITDYERVHEALKGLSVSSELEPNLFYIFGAMLFSFKNGVYCEGQYGFLFSDIKAQDMFSKWSSTYELNAFQNWIVKGIWDKNSFINEINTRFNKNILSARDKFILYSIWDLEQSDIENGIPEIANMAYAGKLSRDQLISFLQKIHFLKDYSIPMPCEIDYSKFEEGFQLRKRKILDFEIIEPRRHTFCEKYQIDKEAYKLYDDIEDFDKKLYVLEPRKKLIEYLKSDDRINLYNFKNKLIGCFDEEVLELFYNKYLESDNAQKREMCFTLLDISFSDKNYLNDNEIQETIKNLNELKARVESSIQNENDYITAIINKSFSDKIVTMVAEIENSIKKIE